MQNRKGHVWEKELPKVSQLVSNRAENGTCVLPTRHTASSIYLSIENEDTDRQHGAVGRILESRSLGPWFYSKVCHCILAMQLHKMVYHLYTYLQICLREVCNVGSNTDRLLLLAFGV